MSTILINKQKQEHTLKTILDTLKTILDTLKTILDKLKTILARSHIGNTVDPRLSEPLWPTATENSFG